MHADLEQLKEEKGENKYSDIESNTTKYLSLLPPLQQLDGKLIGGTLQHSRKLVSRVQTLLCLSTALTFNEYRLNCFCCSPSGEE